MRYLLSLLVLVPIGLLLIAVIGLFSPVLRWIGRFAVAGVAALITALLAPGAGAGWAPLAVFAGVLALLSIRGQRTPPGRPSWRVPLRPAAPAFPEPGPDWQALRGLSDWRTRRRLDAAWDACARYLLLAETAEDPSAQLPIKIARHVPAIVADGVRHAATATSDERRALVADLLGTLETLADRAEERRRTLAHDAQGSFRTLKSHLTRPDD